MFRSEHQCRAVSLESCLSIIQYCRREDSRVKRIERACWLLAETKKELQIRERLCLKGMQSRVMKGIHCLCTSHVCSNTHTHTHTHTHTPQRAHYCLENAAVKCTHTIVTLRSTTFTSQPVAKETTLASAREGVTGVQEDEKPQDWVNKAPKNCLWLTRVWIW